MATRTLGPGSLKIGLVASPREFATDLTKTELTPDTSSDDDVDLLDGSIESGEDTTKWALSGTLLQDYELDSLELYCFDHQGEEMPFVFTPNNEGAVSWSGMVKIRPVKVGGDVKKKNSSDFEFPVIGTPTHSPRV